VRNVSKNYSEEIDNKQKIENISQGEGNQIQKIPMQIENQWIENQTVVLLNELRIFARKANQQPQWDSGVPNQGSCSFDHTQKFTFLQMELKFYYSIRSTISISKIRSERGGITWLPFSP
jgi:hypothetical protein